MSGGISCTCGRRNNDHSDLVVVMRNCNHSAFNGYRRTPSDYSQVKCTRRGCSGSWRTKAAYVPSLPDDGDACYKIGLSDYCCGTDVKKVQLRSQCAETPGTNLFNGDIVYMCKECRKANNGGFKIIKGVTI